MSKKIFLVVILTIIGLIVLPIPFRYGKVFCESPPGKPGRSCPKEGDFGWNSPLIIQLITSIANSRLRIIQTGEKR